MTFTKKPYPDPTFEKPDPDPTLEKKNPVPDPTLEKKLDLAPTLEKQIGSGSDHIESGCRADLKNRIRIRKPAEKNTTKIY